MKKLSEVDYGRIVAYREQGLSFRKIEEITQIPKSTLCNLLKKYEENGTFKRKTGSGRFQITNYEDRKKIKNVYNNNPKMSAPKLNKILEKEHKIIISNQTMRRELKKMNIYAYSPISKPLLSQKNILKRKELCGKWLWKSDKYWENVIFSDECKFNLYNSDGCSYVWRESHKGLDSKYLNTTVKFGRGSLMVWGCFSSKGIGRLVFIDEIMDKFLYLNILRNNLKASANEMGLYQFVFQQDNDPKHTSQLLKDFFINENIEILEWPSQSPDLNPIEHLWAYMKRQLRGKNFKTKEELKAELTVLWKSIPLDLVTKLVNSIPKRIEKIFKANGRSINY